MNRSETLKELGAALAKAQAEMSGAKKSANNPFFKSKYANLEEIIHCVKEPFAKHGLSFLQFPVSEGDYVGVETVILHESGEFVSNHFYLACAKVDPQGMGSAITYARRYGLQAAIGIPSEDDDGEGAMTRKPKITEADAIAKIDAAKSLDELKKAWTSIPPDLQKDEAVITHKDEAKRIFEDNQ